MSSASVVRSHRINCPSKKQFASQMLADNYALLLEWAYPDEPSMCGMGGYKCTACDYYHIGHPRYEVVRSRHGESGRASRSETDPYTATHTANALGTSRRVG